MDKFLAVVFVIVLLMLNHLGTFWFVFGIWPKSWAAFSFFTLTSILVGALSSIVFNAKEN